MGSEPARRAAGAQTLTRRRLLWAAGATGLGGLLAGCTGGSEPAAPTTSSPPPAVDPLLALLTDREALLVRYDATGVTHPDLVGRLQPLQAQTAEQVIALRLALALPTATPAASVPSSGGSTSGGPASGGSTSGGSTSGAPAGPFVPTDPAAALAEVRAAVRAGGSTAEVLCLSTSAERAPLVGSLAAAAACHDLMLS